MLLEEDDICHMYFPNKAWQCCLVCFIQWNSSYSTAKVTLKCSTCEAEQKDHTQQFDASVASVTEPADCTNDGKITYTAKITVNGVEFIDAKEKTLTALGHNYVTISVF